MSGHDPNFDSGSAFDYHYGDNYDHEIDSESLRDSWTWTRNGIKYPIDEINTPWLGNICNMLIRREASKRLEVGYSDTEKSTLIHEITELDNEIEMIKEELATRWKTVSIRETG